MTTLAFGLGLLRPAPPSGVRDVAPPAAARKRSTLARINYEDAFLVNIASNSDVTPEGWSRTILEGAPPLVREGLKLGWRALGLRLGATADDDRVLGWRVQASTSEYALLAATSPLGFAAEILFERRPDGLLFCTFVHNKNPIAHALWGPLGPWHRQVVRTLLAAR